MSTLNSSAINETILRKNRIIAERLRQKRAEGRVEIHRAQDKQKNNPTMAIWLGKQHLGQSDIVGVDIGEGTKHLLGWLSSREKVIEGTDRAELPVPTKQVECVEVNTK
jgi:hypothetical protein